MALGELKKHGIDAPDIFSNLDFTGFPQNKVVYSVLEGRFDAGTFRTDELETLAQLGKINLADIKVLNLKKADGFPFLLSTDLYPEWPFAKTKNTSEHLAKQVALALLKVTEQDPAAKAGNIAGWTVPLNYKPAMDLMKSLKVGPFTNLGKITPARVIRTYWYWLLLGLCIFAGVSLLAFNNYCLNCKLKNVNKTLADKMAQTEELTNKLRYKATHDSLTGAYNRCFFRSSIENAIADCENNHKKFAVMLIDLNDFKPINDTHGHHMGDLLLQQFSKRIQNTLLQTDIFARIGGDEFGILSFDITEAGLTSLKKRILSIARQPYAIDRLLIHSSFSFGTAIYPIHGTSIKELFTYADRQMYKHKEITKLPSNNTSTAGKQAL